MLWPAEHLHETYEHIRNDALGSGCSVVIYVALDCDALCAVKILTSLLKADNVAYKLRPVRGYSDILEDFRETSKAEAIKSIIMINCGGDVNAQEMFNLDDGMTCYIIDSARPYNHANLLRSHMHTIVFADDFMKEEDLVKEAELLEHLDEDNVDELLGSNENDDDDDDDDDDDSDDGKGEVEDGNDANSARNGQEGEIDSDEEHEFDGGNPQQNASDSDDDENEDANKQTSNNTNNKTSKAKSASQLLTEQEEAEIERELAAENGTRKKRRRTSSSSSSSQNDKNNDSGDDDDDDDDDDNDDDNDDDSLPKRKVREKVDAEEPMDDKARVAKYYAGSFRGTSAAHVLFSLSQRLNKDQKIFLWLAIVGTTHHFINSELSEEDYLLRVLTYQDLVKDRSMSRRAGQHTVTEDGAEVPLMEGQSMEFIEELRLMLHRHWSLHEAFLYSDYIAAKLGIWKNDGEAKLRTFFAKMGISRKEAEQKYSFMNMSVKRALKDKIGAHGADFSLDESFVYASFQFRAGFGHQLSAADTAYCMAALLESAATHPTVFADDSGADATEDATEIPEVDLDGDDLDYAGEDGANGQKENSKAILAASLWKQSFNAAYDALSFSQTTRNQHLLEQGLNLAKALQKAIIQEGGNIISGTKIASAGSFRYCILEGLPPKLVSIFSQPDTLLRLAKFIMLAYTSAGKWSGLGAKPLVLGVKNLKTNKAHFVGLPHPTFGDDAIAKNPFGRYFRVAAQKVGTAHIHVGFSSACIEIPLELVQKFLVALHEITA